MSGAAHLFNIVLVHPDIPGNTGSVGRTCVALNLRLILVKPYGFNLDEKSVRRAGLDYWKYVNLTEYQDFSEFINQENPQEMSFFSKGATQSYFDHQFKKNCYLIFGSETKGLPSEIFENYASSFLSLPMYSDKIRSLNLANCATAVAYEALRQIKTV
jgi:tRNA (cytidine/uridine-2'-O-)-methyltransferase